MSCAGSRLEHLCPYAERSRQIPTPPRRCSPWVCGRRPSAQVRACLTRGRLSLVFADFEDSPASSTRIEILTAHREERDEEQRELPAVPGQLMCSVISAGLTGEEQRRQ